MLVTKTLPDPAPWLMKESEATYIKHDLLFKRLLETFFTEFIEAFFPELYDEIDFKSMKFLSEEMVPGLHDKSDRRLDIVVEVIWKKTETIIVIHVEPQGYYQSDFNKRMFHYYSLLYRKVDKPIIPIAIFSYDEAWDKADFKLQVGHFEVLKFKYLTLHLRKMNWHEFLHKENPVSAALLSKMGYTEKERIKVKIEFFRILTQLKIDLEKQDILVDFFQTYLKLSEEEEEIFVREVKKLDNSDEILEIPVLYSERMKAIGREEGRQEGRQEGRKEEREEVAIEMLKDGLTIERVMKYSRLSRDQVEQLKNGL